MQGEGVDGRTSARHRVARSAHIAVACAPRDQGNAFILDLQLFARTGLLLKLLDASLLTHPRIRTVDRPRVYADAYWSSEMTCELADLT